MSLSADVVVIGGGVNGVSTAFHLAKRGVQVTLLERTTLAFAPTCTKSGANRRRLPDSDHATGQQPVGQEQEVTTMSNPKTYWGASLKRAVTVPEDDERPRIDDLMAATKNLLAAIQLTSVSPSDAAAKKVWTICSPVRRTLWPPSSKSVRTATPPAARLAAFLLHGDSL